MMNDNVDFEVVVDACGDADADADDNDDDDDDVLHWYWRPGRGLHLGRLGCTALLLPAALLHCTALFKVIIVGLHCSTANRFTRGNALQDWNIALHFCT